MTAPQISLPGRKGKILVIDDELDIREGLYDLLTLDAGDHSVLEEESMHGRLQQLANVGQRAVVRANDAAQQRDVLPDPRLHATGDIRHTAEGAPLPEDASLFEIGNEFERVTHVLPVG